MAGKVNAPIDACPLCDIAFSNYRSAVIRWERLLDADAPAEGIEAAEVFMHEQLDVCNRYEREHVRGQHQDVAAPCLTTVQLNLDEADVTEAFQQIATFYANAVTVNEQLRRREIADECAIARDGALAVVTLLSERAAANEAECNALIAKLRASLIARHVA